MEDLVWCHSMLLTWPLLVLHFSVSLAEVWCVRSRVWGEHLGVALDQEAGPLYLYNMANRSMVKDHNYLAVVSSQSHWPPCTVAPNMHETWEHCVFLRLIWSVSLCSEMKQMNLVTGKQRLVKRAPFSISAFRYGKWVHEGWAFLSLLSYSLAENQVD